MDNKKIALVGWNPDVLDYSQRPELTAEKVRAALESEIESLNQEGFDAQLIYIESADTAVTTVHDVLQADDHHCVMIGAGVRLDPSHFLIFEQLVNTVHQSAPSAKICFNTHPGDTKETIMRWA